ncbi:N-6 DNA methylase [Deinococcus kurensis]|uniref:N-6 DNA methylase n=1 Tax=Deinococcus kurensis TaxID=2662757 RepID=UPI001391C309|nr:N-6 DNA methylase [Deinococcus kurensis]
MLRELNQYFTPASVLADIEALISTIQKNEANLRIADFTAGEGALLESAENYFSNAIYVANDIDKSLCRRLKLKKPYWLVFNRDFDKVISPSGPFSPFDIILANPPFSGPGSRDHMVKLENNSYKCSYVIKFIIKCLKFMKPEGHLIIVAPSSILHSNKDKEVLSRIKYNFKFNIIREYSDKTFPRCNASTVLIHIQKSKPENAVRIFSDSQESIEIIRGWVPIHTTYPKSKDLTPVLHTTNLWKEIIEPEKYTDSKRSLSGAFLLIPRVGKPYKEKIIICERDKFALSDCLFAIKGEKSYLIRLQSLILEDEGFAKIYGGTGAKYISIDHLKDYISKLQNNRSIDIVRDMLAI